MLTHVFLLKESSSPPKIIDLKNQTLAKGAVEVLSDLLSVNFGLKRLVLENCGLDDEVSRILHSSYAGPLSAASANQSSH